LRKTRDSGVALSFQGMASSTPCAIFWASPFFQGEQGTKDNCMDTLNSWLNCDHFP
jgi:hypothetical protein